MSYKRLYVKTYGCQMNVHDSARLIETLKPLGYAEVTSPAEADLIIVNTCFVRQAAEEKLFSELGRIRLSQKSGAQIIVMGCVGQALGKTILERAPYVHAVFGPRTFHHLPAFLEEGGECVHIDGDACDKFQHMGQATPQISAFVSIQEGCNKFCRYCSVPYTRGPEVSRPIDDILREARDLVAKGTKEITLLGQNVNAFKITDHTGYVWTLASLLYALEKINGLTRVRYISAHPIDFTDDLIRAHGELPTLMPFLHLPAQAGSDAILKAMGRRYTRAEYLSLIDRLRSVCPSIAFSSDFIVGFPGETDQDFAATCSLAEDVRYARAFSFAYSPRPGTPASRMEQLSKEIKHERLLRLQEILDRHQKEFNVGSIGTEMPVLVEKRGRYPGQWAGKSPYLQAVYFLSPEPLLGEVCHVRINGATKNSLSAVLSPMRLKMF